jgi:hypothetical protein
MRANARGWVHKSLRVLKNYSEYILKTRCHILILILKLNNNYALSLKNIFIIGMSDLMDKLWISFKPNGFY